MDKTKKNLKEKIKHCKKRAKGYIVSVNSRQYDDALTSFISPDTNPIHTTSVSIGYEYKVKNRKYYGNGEISAFKLNGIESIGKEIVIYYDPEKPRNSCTSHDKSYYGIRYVFKVITLLLFFCILYYLCNFNPK